MQNLQEVIGVHIGVHILGHEEALCKLQENFLKQFFLIMQPTNMHASCTLLGHFTSTFFD